MLSEVTSDPDGISKMSCDLDSDAGEEEEVNREEEDLSDTDPEDEWTDTLPKLKKGL